MTKYQMENGARLDGLIRMPNTARLHAAPAKKARPGLGLAIAGVLSAYAVVWVPFVLYLGAMAWLNS